MTLLCPIVTLSLIRAKAPVLQSAGLQMALDAFSNQYMSLKADVKMLTT